MKTQSQSELIASIAVRTNTPVRDVEAAYEAACEALRKEARFQDFLPLLAAKRVSEQLRKPH